MNQFPKFLRAPLRAVKELSSALHPISNVVAPRTVLEASSIGATRGISFLSSPRWRTSTIGSAYIKSHQRHHQPGVVNTICKDPIFCLAQQQCNITTTSVISKKRSKSKKRCKSRKRSKSRKHRSKSRRRSKSRKCGKKMISVHDCCKYCQRRLEKTLNELVRIVEFKARVLAENGPTKSKRKKKKKKKCKKSKKGKKGKKGKRKRKH